jgi:hypothetical protein
VPFLREHEVMFERSGDGSSVTAPERRNQHRRIGAGEF